MATILTSTLLLFGIGTPAHAHGEAVDVLIEAVTHQGEDLGVVDYGIGLAFVDGDPLTDASVGISVSPGEGIEVEPTTETVPGVYIGRVRFSGEGEWRVTLSFDSPDSSGSVEFTQEVRESAPISPVVLVDTLEPDRVGTMVEGASSLFGDDPGDVQVGDHSSPIVVEAMVETATMPLLIDYAATIDDSPAASVTLSAQADGGDAVAPKSLTEVGGVHRVEVHYPSADLWTVSLEVATAAGRETVTFKENLPWPHYTTEAGQPKVKYDSAFPDRIGTIVAESASIYFRQVASDDTETTTAASTPTTAEQEPTLTTSPAIPEATDEPDEVVLNITEPADELRVDIGLRVLHVAALGLWVVPLIASGFGAEHRFSVPLVVSGMALAAVTGVLLALWGAPVSFPGLLRWEDLATRFYGDAYLFAFIAKMATALLAFIATIVWIARRSKIALFIVFGGLGAAVMAVTAMSQFHLFSHL